MVRQSPGWRFGLYPDLYARFYPSQTRAHSPYVAANEIPDHDESSHNHPPERQSLFQALGIVDLAQRQHGERVVVQTGHQKQGVYEQPNSDLLQEVVNQGSALHSIVQSRPFSSTLQPISIISQSGSLTHARQRLRDMLHSFNQRSRVHPTNFNHSPDSHFSSFLHVLLHLKRGLLWKWILQNLHNPQEPRLPYMVSIFPQLYGQRRKEELLMWQGANLWEKALKLFIQIILIQIGL